MSKISEAAKNARTKAGDKGVAAKRKAGEIYNRGRDAASRGAESSKELASKARDKSSETVDSNPLVAVVGGLALGAVIGALLPTTSRERKVMGRTGKKINDRAKTAVNAAKDAGQQRMSEVGLDAEHAKDQVKAIFGKATDAAKAAGNAASEAAKKSS